MTANAAFSRFLFVTVALELRCGVAQAANSAWSVGDRGGRVRFTYFKGVTVRVT
jgi:hypothetical protein